MLRVRRSAWPLQRVAWTALGLLIALWAIGYVGWPFSTDQGVLSWVGRVIANGGMPYRDAWEIRGPAPFLVYAGIARVFGPEQWPLRVVDLCFVAGGAWCVARIAATFGGQLAGRCAAVFYVLWYASLGHHDTAQSDGWNAAMMAAVVVAMIARGGSPVAGHAAFAGVMLGLSILSKPPYVVFVLLPVIVGFAQARERGVGWLMRFWGAGVLAMGVSAGAVLLWLYRGGAFNEFIDIHIRWLLARYTDVESSWLNRAQTAAVFFTSDILATAIAPAVLGVAMVWRREKRCAALLVAWLGGAVLTAMAQGNFYPYHWHPTYPALATFAGIGISAIFGLARQPNDGRVRLVGFAVAGAVLAAAALRPAVHVYRNALYAVGVVSRERYDEVEFGPYGPTGALTRLADYLHSNTRRGDYVLVWGSVPGVYYISERNPPSRFGYTAPLVTSQDDAYRRRYRAEFMTAISTRRPVFIATLAPSVCAKAHDVDQRHLIGRAEERMRCVDELPGLEELLATSYQPDSTIGPIALYRRQDLEGPLDLSAARAVQGRTSPAAR
jgi:hypothetical protein